MNTAKFLLIWFAVCMVGCSNKCYDVGKKLPGTNTAVVGIYLNKDGVPQETVKEVVVNPGNKVLYAGPDEFSIVFKNRKTPNRQIENKSKNGVVVIEIPEDIFSQQQFSEEFKRNNSLVFDYGIRVGDKELDPPIRVVPPGT